MGNSAWDYTGSEASSSTTGGWNTAEGQDPSTVNDGMRQHKQNVYNLLRDFGGGTTTTGSANAHAVTLNQAIATTIPTNFIFRVKFGYTNTSTTVNLNVNSIGNKRIKVNYGGLLGDPLPGDIRAGAYGTLLYDGTQFVLLDAQQQGRYPPLFGAQPSGYSIANNSSDATNDIDFPVQYWRDSTDSVNIDCAAMTKRLDADWSAGTGNGMRYSGAAIANTTYHLYTALSSTGAQDYYADPSATASTALGHLQAETGGSAYLYLRRIGSIVRTGGAIKAFIQSNDLFLWNSPVEDIQATNPGASAVTRTLTLPTGVIYTAVVQGGISNGTNASNHALLSSLALTDVAASNSVYNVHIASLTAYRSFQTVFVPTNTSAQIRSRLSVSGASDVLFINTVGWIDSR